MAKDSDRKAPTSQAPRSEAAEASSTAVGSGSPQPPGEPHRVGQSRTLDGVADAGPRALEQVRLEQRPHRRPAGLAAADVLLDRGAGDGIEVAGEVARQQRRVGVPTLGPVVIAIPPAAR